MLTVVQEGSPGEEPARPGSLIDGQRGVDMIEQTVNRPCYLADLRPIVDLARIDPFLDRDVPMGQWQCAHPDQGVREPARGRSVRRMISAPTAMAGIRL